VGSVVGWVGNKKCGAGFSATQQIGGSMKKLPKGCDYQGRFPEAAEAATEVGQEDEEQANLVFLWAVVAILVITIIAIGVAIWGEGQ
jgi:hypothetical protein